MAKEYFRWELQKTLGIISSAQCNVIYFKHKSDDSSEKYIATGALEKIYIWRVATGELVHVLHDDFNTSEVTFLATPKTPNIIASGHVDGTIRLWSVSEKRNIMTLAGHRSAISAMAFGIENEVILASGSKDGSIIIWNTIEECGICRLSGHVNAVTGLIITPDEVLISSGRDSIIRCWDLGTQHCGETVVIHTAEITSIIMTEDLKLLTIGGDEFLRVFRYKPNALKASLTQLSSEHESCLFLIDEIKRNFPTEKATSLSYGSGYAVIGCTSGALDIFRVRSQKEFNEFFARKEKRRNNKQLSNASIRDVGWVKSKRFTRLDGRTKTMSIASEWNVTKNNGVIKILVGFSDNRLAEVLIDNDISKEIEYNCLLDVLGHRSDCRLLAFRGNKTAANHPSSNYLESYKGAVGGTVFASASKEQIKIWNVHTGSIVRSIPVFNITVMEFLDDFHLLVGDEKGTLNLIDLLSGESIGTVRGHEGAIRSMSMWESEIMTGGSDKSLKFWKTYLDSDQKFRIKLIRTLEVADEIQVLRHSVDGKFIAIATLDLTVRIFFRESLKFHLSLYGHRLPITAVQFSDDSRLIFTASADKNFKVWSVQFGECRKSVFAHGDALTGLLIANSHESNMFKNTNSDENTIKSTGIIFTSSKDGLVKIWDTENPSKEIQRLKAHNGDVMSAAITFDYKENNLKLVTTGKDRSIRIWVQTNEPLFPEEEEDRIAEEQIEKSMVEVKPNEPENLEGAISIRTITSLKAGERIMEAIESADIERRKELESPGNKLAPEPLYLALKGAGKQPSVFLLDVFETIPFPDLEQALLTLPSHALPSLLHYAQEWLSFGSRIFSSARIISLVISIFHQIIRSQSSLRPVLISICKKLRERLENMRELISLNQAGIYVTKTTSSQII